MKEVFDLEVGDLFSFKKNSPVYMVSRKAGNHIEYQSYNDGKIRVILKDDKLNRKVFLRPEYDAIFEVKFFRNMDYI